MQPTGPTGDRSRFAARAVGLEPGLTLVLTLGLAAEPAAQVPHKLQRWLGPQVWERDTDGPVLSLGEKGSFDDTHVFAPMVAVVDGVFMLWYCGSSGTAHDLAPRRVPDNRCFRLGLATSEDGELFTRHPASPVMELKGASGRSILTPSILRGPDGAVQRVAGQIRVWFSSAAFRGDDRVHAIQDATSADGVVWSEPSPVYLERAYAPSVIRSGADDEDDGGYEMWFTRVSRYPWVMLHARSDDGRDWRVTEKPVLEISQPWEHFLQIYPSVMRVDGVYLMWYASYANEERTTTAIGFAVSEDGVRWHKHPQNPVLTADPRRPWESHYVSSQTVVRMPDGSFRMWYASRKAPPFTNLYFALNTARWSGPRSAGGESERGR